MGNCCNQEPATTHLGGTLKPDGLSRGLVANYTESDKAAHAPAEGVAIPVGGMNQVDPKVGQVESTKGPYKFDPKTDAQFQGLPTLGPYKYETGATYYGQYKNGMRHGRGRLVWNDGTVYEGYWLEDKFLGV